MNKSLAKHITFLVTILLSTCLVVLAFVILSAKKLDISKQFENDQSLNLTLISTSISEPLYTYNTSALNAITNSFLNSWDQSIQKITVSDFNGETIISNQTRDLSKIEKGYLFEKNIKVKFEDKEIGNLTIVFSNQNLNNEFKKWSLGIFIYTLLAIIVLILFFHTAFSNLITRPLSKLISELSKLRKNDYSAKVEGEFKFELGIIAHDFNEAIENIRIRDERINQYATSLENMVVERTKERDEQTVKAITSARLASVGEMSAGIAHEINNPLAVINALASQVFKRLEKRNDEFVDEIEKISKIKSMVLRIQKIIEGVKKFSRDGENQNYEYFDLTIFVDSIKDLTNYKMISSSISFQIDLNLTTKLIYGQEIQFSQVLINLINNSVDAISELEGDKFIRLEIKEHDGRHYFRLIDSGDGIPESVQVKMLEPFYTTKGQGKGTGLGLSLSREIIRKHGGDLYYVKENKNTTFEFYIPIR